MTIAIPDAYKTYRILGIDPGLTYTGIAIYTLNNYSELKSVEAFTIQPSLRDTSVLLDSEIVGDRYIRLMSLLRLMREVTCKYNPSVVACEGPFYSSFRPTAYASLVETINYIKQGIYGINPYTPTEIIQPLLIKKTIGAGMQKGKIDVAKAVSMNETIMKALTMNLDTLDEHSIDAIAIAYTYLVLSGVL